MATMQVTGDMAVGDLVMSVGDSLYSILKPGVIYQVVEQSMSTGDHPVVQFRYREAFNFGKPLGSSVDVTPAISARDIRRLSLLDLGSMRLHFDSFIREYARSQGMEVDGVARERLLVD